MSLATVVIRTLPIYLVRANALIACALGILSLFTAIYLWTSLHVHIPIRDTIRFMSLVQTVLDQDLFSYPVSEWLAPHSSAHRVTIIKIAMVIDHAYFGGQNHFIYFLTWASVATMFMVFFSAFRRSYQGEHSLLLFISGLSLTFLLSHTQTWNMINPINSSWYVSLAACTVSLFLIVRSPQPPGTACFLAAFLVANFAALANFTGVLLFLLLPVFIGMRSLRLGLFSALIALALFALYLRGISAGPVLSGAPESNSATGLLTAVLQLVGNAPSIITRTCLILGSPLSKNYPGEATALVLISFLVLGSAWIAFFRGRLSLAAGNTWFEIMLATASLTLALAIATSMGRGLVVEPTVERYQTFVMLYWLCICGLAIAFAMNTSAWRPWALLVSTCSSFAIVLALLSNQSHTVRESAIVNQKANRVSVLTLMGAPQFLNYRRLGTGDNPRELADLEPHFKKHESSYWFDADTELGMGEAEKCKIINMRLSPSRRPGIFETSVRIRDFWSQLNQTIPVTTAQGYVIGYLVRDFGGEVTLTSMITGQEGWWKGFLRMNEVTDGEVYLHYRRSPFSSNPCRQPILKEND